MIAKEVDMLRCYNRKIVIEIRLFLILWEVKKYKNFYNITSKRKLMENFKIKLMWIQCDKWWVMGVQIMENLKIKLI